MNRGVFVGAMLVIALDSQKPFADAGRTQATQARKVLLWGQEGSPLRLGNRCLA